MRIFFVLLAGKMKEKKLSTLCSNMDILISGLESLMLFELKGYLLVKTNLH